VSSTRWLGLIANTHSREGLAALAEGLGFGVAAPLDRRSCESLGLPDDLETAQVADGPGTARALLVEV
jgi:hypothetical protein